MKEHDRTHRRIGAVQLGSLLRPAIFAIAAARVRRVFAYLYAIVLRARRYISVLLLTLLLPQGNVEKSSYAKQKYPVFPNWHSLLSS
jgi:hypothetical protein